MASNILINFTADNSGLDESGRKLDELVQKEKELVKTMEEAKSSGTKAYDSTKADADRTKALDEYNKTLEKNTKIQKDNKKQVESSKNSIKTLSDTFSKLDASIVKGAAPEYLKSTKKELSDLVTQMQSSGKISDETFQNMSSKLNELEESSDSAGGKVKDLAPAFDDVGTSVKKLDRTLKATLWGLILGLIAAVVMAMKDYIIEMYNAVNGIDKFNAKLDENKRLSELSASTISEQTIAYRKLQSQWNSLGDDLNEKKRFVDENKEAFNKLGFEVNGVSDAENVLVRNTDTVIKAIQLRAEAEANYQFAVEQMKKAIETRNQTEIDLAKRGAVGPSFKDYAQSYLTKGLFLEGSDMSPEEIWKADLAKIAKTGEEAANAYMKGSEDAIKRNEELAIEAQNITKNAGVKTYQEASKTTKNITDDILKYEQELNEKLKAEHLKAIKDNEAREVLAVKQQYDKKLEAIRGNSKKENQLRSLYEENMQADIQKIKDKYDVKAQQVTLQTEKRNSDIRLAALQKGSEEYYRERETNLNAIANLEKNRIQNSTATEEEKSLQIENINRTLIANITKLWDDYSRDYRKKSIEDIKASADQESLNVTQQYEQGKISRRKYESELENITINSLEKQIEARKSNGEDTVKLEKELSDRRIAIAEREKEAKVALQDEFFNTISSIGNMMFDMERDNLQTQLDNLSNLYTTDAEEAKNNKNLKLITEEEYNKKQLALKRQAAKSEKEQALFNLTLTQGQAIARAYKDFPWPFNIAIAALMGIQVLAQINKIKSQQLPSYWKGRKSGKGEFAMVGEQGAELMYVPEGASIMPAVDTQRAMSGNLSVMSKWNMPAINPNYPVSPVISQQLVNDAKKSHNAELDYDKMGRVFAKYQKKNPAPNISISYDKTGLTVQNGNTTTKYLNGKFE